jgi:DNA topoisomerase-1
LLNCYLDGGMVLEIKSKVEAELRDEIAGLQPEEAAVLALLGSRRDRDD